MWLLCDLTDGMRNASSQDWSCAADTVPFYTRVCQSPRLMECDDFWFLFNYPDSVLMFQRPTSSICCASGDGYPPDPSWRHSSGRPRTTWLDHISSDTGVSLTDTFSLAQDHSQWRAIATATKAMHTWLTEPVFLENTGDYSRLGQVRQRPPKKNLCGIAHARFFYSPDALLVTQHWRGTLIDEVHDVKRWLTLLADKRW